MNPFEVRMTNGLAAMSRNRALLVTIALTLCLTGHSEATPESGISSEAPDGVPASAGIQRIPEAGTPGRCASDGQDASPSRPTWTGGASTSECGQLQTDFGLLVQPIDDHTSQWMLPSNMRYGLTLRVELRWGLPTHLEQTGGSAGPLRGVSDQSLGLQYWFNQQRRLLPALALSYGVKIPSANPDKGFGTGYVDHQFVLIASRDAGRVHFDLNADGTVAGGEDNYSGAVQLGLALSMPLSKRFTWVMDNYGGSQSGTSDRLGAALVGGTWSLRPSLVLDGAYTRIYTGGQPRQIFTIGITQSMRLGVLPIHRGSMLARVLGR